MAKALEAEIDKLFQLTPGEFTAARNALAKGAGSQAVAIKALAKPPIAAWAVNQLYWRDSDRYEALIEAATEMRTTHRAVIEGRKADLRSAGREHELALEAALKSTMTLLKEAGQPATDATRHAVLNTLRALPSDEPPGRLTRTLSPGGFEMLAGITPKAGLTPAQRPHRSVDTTAPSKGGTFKGGREADREARESARDALKERERRAAAERAMRDAEQKTRQAEFEAARAAREATRAERQLEAARHDLDTAQQAFDAADKNAAKAVRARATADQQLEDARAAVEAARGRR